VPRWHLERWSFGEGLICVLGDDGLPTVMPTGVAGSLVDGYTIFGTDGTRDDTIELQLLRTVDDAGAAVVRSALKNGFPRGPRQQEHPARFIGWLIVRGPVLARISAQTAATLNARREAGEIERTRTAPRWFETKGSRSVVIRWALPV
jgi:hypothetical protein